MASLKRSARSQKSAEKVDSSTDGVLELSVTVGYLSADVKKDEMGKLERLLHDHCAAGLVALERGDLEQHLHFQMVCQARVKSARSFGILVRKYMDWFGLRNMSPVGKVTCKVLTNRLLHTWKGMIGYCLKDSGTEHFEVAMYNISDQDVVAGKTLHAIYGKADLKSRVVLTNKNVGERAYVWYKYRENRQLTATFLSTLTDMIQSAMFIPSAAWIIPVTGLGMEQRRVNSFWKCLTDPSNIDRADVADVFIRKREFVRGRYYDEDDVVPSVFTDTGNEYTFEASPCNGKAGSDVDKVTPTPVSRCIPRSLQVPPLSGRVKQEGESKVMARNINITSRKKLFEESSFIDRPAKAVKFSDNIVEFYPLVDKKPLPTNVCLPTNDVLTDSCISKTPSAESEFWNMISNCASGCSSDSVVKTDLGDKITAKGKGKLVPSDEDILYSKLIVLSSDSESDVDVDAVEKVVIEISSDSEQDDVDAVQKVVIEISSDSEEDDVAAKLSRWPKNAAESFVDRKPSTPAYFLAGNLLTHVLSTDTDVDGKIT